MHPAINLFPLLAFRGRRWRTRLNALPLLRRGRLKAEEELVRCPIVVTFHDLKVPYLFPKAGPLRDGAVTLLARHSDAAIATNRVDNLTLVARGVVHVERIPIGSNITPILPNDYDRGAWRAKLHVASDNHLLGFFGFFNARKGIETLVRALAAMDHSYHLLFVGGTIGSSDATNRAYAEHIRTLIAELNLTERVHYTGYVPAAEVSAAFAAIDLCVLPYAGGISLHHGTLMAAMAHGQPIISTRPPIELPELIHGENVWLVPPDDADALAAAVTTLAADPARRRRLAEGAGELSTRFSWEHIAVRTADLFESVRRAS
jgi:glycosyltransferase involved in cell wall biosynthesis